MTRLIKTFPKRACSAATFRRWPCRAVALAKAGVPKGRIDNSPALQCRVQRKNSLSPEGTAERVERRPSPFWKFPRKTGTAFTRSLLVLIIFGLATTTAWSINFKPPQSLPGADLFTDGSIRRLQIQILPAGIDSLRRDPREYVHATVTENGTVYTDIAVHVKGSVGSFRDVDDKPDLTLDFNRFNSTRKFHDLRRVYLNNSVEDPSYCNELLGGELFRAAGVPAPRVAHAVVTLNGRRLGLYVLKEGFTEDFLGCYFKHIGANLYEPGDGHDVNQRLKRNAVVAPKQDGARLQSLADAVLDPNPTTHWQRLEQILDVDEFVKFMAMEVMIGHRDGYCLARNNYRIYQDIDSCKMVFFPHGMDQLFGNPDATWLPHMSGLTAKAVMETPEGARQYRATFSNLFTSVFQASPLQARVDQIVAGLRPVLTPAEFAAVQAAANHQKDQIARRQASLTAQLSQPERPVFTFTNGEGTLTDWVKADISAGVKMDRFQSDDHAPVMRIAAHSASGASWRTTVLLPRGRYRFEGSLKVAGVKPLPFGKYQGAGLRVAGSLRDSAGLVGDSAWCIEGTEFTVTDETQEVELICELRASAGEAWFDLKSLKLHQIL